MLKCWNCGKTEPKKKGYVYEGAQRYYCKECYRVVSEEHKKDTQEYVRLKKKLMFERAVSIMERQTLDIYEYQEAIQAVGEFASEKPDKFDSAYEMIAAVVLIHNRIKCELQYKVGRYQCDFCIPSMKVILEIDGDRHKNRVGYDSIRDEEIRGELGAGWNVVRISTDYLDMKADLLVEAIEAVIAERNEQKRKRKAFRTAYK